MNAKCPLLLYLLLRASAAGQFLIPGRCPCLLFGKVSSARFHLTKVIRDHSLRSLQKIFECHLNNVKDFFNVSLASNYRIVLEQLGKNKRLQFLETANCIDLRVLAVLLTWEKFNSIYLFQIELEMR